MAAAPPALRVALLVSYDGSAFAGFQSQANGRAVQDVLETALLGVYGRPNRVRGASRTDAGVHAAGQVASFDLDADLAGRVPVERLPFALAHQLPDDVAVLAARPASLAFDPRRAERKAYRYRILARPAPCPLRRARTWHVAQPLDLNAMRSAAGAALGRHDFSAFAASGTTVRTRERTVFALDVAERGDEIRIGIEADGFLYRMARNLTGTLVEIGLGRRRVDTVGDALASRDRTRAGATAPPQGLCLEWVRYRADLEAPWLRAPGGPPR